MKFHQRQNIITGRMESFFFKPIYPSWDNLQYTLEHFKQFYQHLGRKKNALRPALSANISHLQFKSQYYSRWMHCKHTFLKHYEHTITLMATFFPCEPFFENMDTLEIKVTGNCLERTQTHFILTNLSLRNSKDIFKLSFYETKSKVHPHLSLSMVSWR